MPVCALPNLATELSQYARSAEHALSNVAARGYHFEELRPDRPEPLRG